MSKETPDSCLCSVIWNWSAYYTQAVDSIIDGTWDGSNYFGGISDGVVELTNLSELVVDGVQEKVDEATASILDGSFNVFDGVMETNTGDKVGVDGGTLDDATILSGIDWYYHNIVVVE
jgi:basic membrane protein A